MIRGEIHELQAEEQKSMNRCQVISFEVLNFLGKTESKKIQPRHPVHAGRPRHEHPNEGEQVDRYLAILDREGLERREDGRIVRESAAKTLQSLARDAAKREGDVVKGWEDEMIKDRQAAFRTNVEAVEVGKYTGRRGDGSSIAKNIRRGRAESDYNPEMLIEVALCADPQGGRQHVEANTQDGWQDGNWQKYEYEDRVVKFQSIAVPVTKTQIGPKSAANAMARHDLQMLAKSCGL
ncbi:hypothetical protein C8J57DRAFT_1246769 [Mycena rebaudengoi]|nr:hypothetical protein C8J57DRAFT_1246769 [Mycena rebaudengoi]